FNMEYQIHLFIRRQCISVVIYQIRIDFGNDFESIPVLLFQQIEHFLVCDTFQCLVMCHPLCEEFEMGDESHILDGVFIKFQIKWYLTMFSISWVILVISRNLPTSSFMAPFARWNAMNPASSSGSSTSSSS